jgi:methionyl-tRNA formyltransferase
MKILFFGDGQWATNSLLRLHGAGWTVQGVVVRTRPTDSSLATAAQELGLHVWQPQRVNAPEFVEQVVELGPDLGVCVSYDQILRSHIRNVAPKGFINLHAGKLPLYRGRNVVNWALINGETEIGITSHFLDDGVDTGDIILQQTLPISWTDTYGDVLQRVVEKIPELVINSVSLIARGEAQRQPQAHLAGTYFPARGPGDEWLDWSDTSRNLHNKIRAITHPGPGARTTLNGRVVIIWRGFYDPSWPTYIATPGQVVGRVEGRGVIVKTGDSTVILEEVQFEDEDNARIPEWSIGTRLGIDRG